MRSDGEESATIESDMEVRSDPEDYELEQETSQVSQDLPSPQDLAHPSKRRRISSSLDDDPIEDSLGDSDSEDDSEFCSSRQKKRPLARASSEEDGEEVAHEKKKSKYKIHIPRDHTVPAMTIQYGTQIPSHPDSSPYRIRGAKWMLPKTTPSNSFQQLSKLNATSNYKPISRPITVTAPIPVDDKNEEFEVPGRSYGPSLGPSPVDLAHELADLPSDAFSSSPEKSPPSTSHSFLGDSQPSQRLIAPLTGLRQTTLFGGRGSLEQQPASQVNKIHNYRMDVVPEEPTHHKLDQEAMKTWIYPTNLGTIRDYQFNIVRMGLYHNSLVALPTGLGKTFIAATIMLNYFRWTKDAQIVFMAPTKPLVSQQVDACFGIVGIPRSATTMLTGEIPPAVRAEEWQQKRVFFMTPQTLDNDLRTGIADPKRIVLLVVDEAHRAKGEYAYVKVVTFMRRFTKSFRVLALTATPGSTVEAVQEVIDGLEISHVEIRSEHSMDIQPYTHSRKIETIVLDPSDEMIMIQDLFAKTLQPILNKLTSQNAYWRNDPMSLTTFGLLQAKKQWFASDAGRKASFPLKGMMNGLFVILGSVAHGIKVLNFHGISPFYEIMKTFRDGVEEKGGKANKYMKEINNSPHFKKMMNQILTWINKDDFVGHPKLTFLCDTILNHFLDAGEGRLPENAAPSSTRVIVFSEYRDSAEDIVRVLNRHQPMIRASVFVGQADSKRSEGMNQAKQLETIRKFKTGTFNVIVATSIGEEGLDIGSVDLIVCYDASGSPIRMLQRMGRTGRKRAGNIVLLLMRGKEENDFEKAKDNYEKMQKIIENGDRFQYRHDMSTRIVPKEIIPEVDKRFIDIPPENTQDTSLPEPKRRASKAKKRPPKKFNMPDGVETGFRKATKLVDRNKVGKNQEATQKERDTDAEAEAKNTRYVHWKIVPLESSHLLTEI
jgi:ATP-dependent DNA helicase MPH1